MKERVEADFIPQNFSRSNLVRKYVRELLQLEEIYDRYVGHTGILLLLTFPQIDHAWVRFKWL